MPLSNLSVEETSLVVQWLRIHLAMQGIWAQSLVGELSPTSRGSTKPTRCNEKIPHATTKTNAAKK